MKTLTSNKDKKSALKQAKRWFKKNPNRKHVNLKYEGETIYLKRVDV